MLNETLAAAPTRVKVRVPAGAKPGDTIEFAVSGDRKAYAMIPPGVLPGAIITINASPPNEGNKKMADAADKRNMNNHAVVGEWSVSASGGAQNPHLAPQFLLFLEETARVVRKYRGSAGGRDNRVFCLLLPRGAI